MTMNSMIKMTMKMMMMTNSDIIMQLTWRRPMLDLIEYRKCQMKKMVV